MHGHDSVLFIPTFKQLDPSHPAVERQNEHILGHGQENLSADLIIHCSSSGALLTFQPHNSAEPMQL